MSKGQMILDRGHSMSVGSLPKTSRLGFEGEPAIISDSALVIPTFECPDTQPCYAAAQFFTGMTVPPSCV